jgi:hypothetical protein
MADEPRWFYTPFGFKLREMLADAPPPFPLRELVELAVAMMPEPEWQLPGTTAPLRCRGPELRSIDDVAAEMLRLRGSGQAWREYLLRTPDLGRLRTFARFADDVDPAGQRSATLQRLVNLARTSDA